MMEPYRIPIAGSYNTRVAAVNVLSSSSGVVGLGIVGSMIVGKTGTTTTKDQRFVNCFTEVVRNPFTGSAKAYCVKRPGFASSLTPQADSIGNEIFVWTGSSSKIISAFGATNSSIYDSTTQLATNNGDTTVITGLARSIAETDLSGTGTLTIASTDSTAWYYQAAGTVTKIADADFPGNAGFTTVGGFAHMDGYAFIMDTRGRIWNSDVNSVTAWTATSFVTANSYPDAGIGCVRYKQHIMAFGTESIQFFYNAGLSAGSPLARSEPMTIKVGCISALAITQMNDAIFWCGSSPEGGIGVYQYSGQGAQRISTPELDAILILVGTGNIGLSATKFYGRSFIIVQASTVTFVYCVEEKAWHEWSSTVPLWNRCAGVSAGSSQVTYAISKTSTAGKVFVVNPASMTFQDNGMAYTATIQTSLLGEDGRRTFWHTFGVEGDTQSSSSDLTVAYNDADYDQDSYVTQGTIDMTAVSPRPLTRCGAAYRRAWVLSHSANTPMRLGDIYGRKSMGQYT